MSTRKKLIDFVSILHKYVFQIPSNLNRQITEDNSKNPCLCSLHDIKTVLEQIKDALIPCLNHYDEALWQELNELGAYISEQDFIFDPQPEDKNDNIPEKIKQINDKLQEIKKLKDEIHFPEWDPKSLKAQEKGSSESEAPKVSRDWLHWRVEKNILESPAMANLQLSYDALDIQLKRPEELSSLILMILTSAEQPIEVENGDFLIDLGAKKHLRYLSLQGISRITTLPSIAKCVNLEILDLRACHNLESLPSDIGSLRKLTHLDVSQTYEENLSKLGDLVQLKKLGKLSIQVGSNAVIKEEELKEFKKTITLRVLTISWGKVALASKNGGQGTKTDSNIGGASSLEGKEDLKLNETATWTMKSFSFPPKLEKLDLRCLPKYTSPEWLKPSNLEGLKKLYISGGKLDALCPEENKKWKVKILRLKYLKNLKIEAEFLQQNFPNLVYFEKFNCHEIGRQSSELIQYEKNVEWNNDEAWEALYEKLKSTSTSEEEKLKSTSTLEEKKLDVNERPQIKT
ncbi:hypothetical protein ACSBR2_027069 [Camellia fascicularis]